jgi:hypothetical protein
MSALKLRKLLNKVSWEVFEPRSEVITNHSNPYTTVLEQPEERI